ncbi:hypothetical protein DP49_5825 [Burkholderia pseudomallei]|nr:hypothetical protein DP49_5825 [Burkholderia pseudomallei]
MGKRKSPCKTRAFRGIGWWRRRESNPRPEAVHDQFYMFSSVI